MVSIVYNLDFDKDLWSHIISLFSGELDILLIQKSIKYW